MPATSTTQNFTKKIKKNFFCINVYKYAKEKLSLGFWVTKMTLLELVFQTAGAINPPRYNTRYMFFYHWLVMIATCKNEDTLKTPTRRVPDTM